MKNILVCVLLCASVTTGWAQDQPRKLENDPDWCPPSGPSLPKNLSADHSLLLMPGWVVIRFHVHPGEVPVTDVRVVSEAGGAAHAHEWLPRVRQWVGCKTNKLDRVVQIRFNFGYEGAYHQPEKEAFGLHAFASPAGAPLLKPNDWGIGICPITATLKLQQPEGKNTVVQMESADDPGVKTWLEGLVPNRDYMVPSLKGNRVVFDCRVEQGQVKLSF